MSPHAPSPSPCDWVEATRVAIQPVVYQHPQTGVWSLLVTPDYRPYLEVELDLWLERGDSFLERVRFKADSGASISVVPLHLAQGYGLAVPPPEQTETVRLLTPAGIAFSHVRRGMIRVRFSNDLAARAFDWPVLFQQAEDDPAKPGYSSRGLLGLCEVILGCRWLLGDPTPDAPLGQLVIQIRAC